MNIAQFDLRAQYASLQDRLDAAWQRIGRSGSYILGAEVAAFERELADYLGGGFVVGVSSGSDALFLALREMGIGAGDEVVLPGYSFTATLEAVLRVGARPKFVDCAEAGFNCAPVDIVAALSPRTRAVIVVHLFGEPVDVAELASVCRARGIALIEDAAQALGSHLAVGKVGTLGDIGCFSFYPTKNLGALGDGGALWVREAERAERLRRLRNHGFDASGALRECGINARLDELQAAMLRVKLPHLDGWIAARRRIARAYRMGLRAIGEDAQPRIVEGHSYNQFCLLDARRDELAEYLLARGIHTRVYYREPLYRHPAMTTGVPLANCELRAARALALPIYPELPEEAIARICEAINEFALHRPRREGISRCETTPRVR